jgi:acetoin utilization protein AcuB
MRVKDLMHTAVFTVGPQDPVDRVFFLIHYEKIRHLPVVEKGQVVGIVSDRDLYKALGPRSRSRMVTEGADSSSLYVIPKKARHIMRRGVITIEPDDFASRAASLMARRKVGALPVVKNGRLVGIITATDLLAAFARMTAPSAAAC